MKRPLVPVALLHIAGILAGHWLAVPLPALFILSFILLGAALVWTRVRLWLLCPLILLAGWTNLAHRTAILSPYDLRTIIGNNQAAVSVRGLLRETPQRHLRLDKTREIRSSTAQLDVTALSISGGPWQPASGRVATSTGDWLLDKFFAGQTVTIDGVIKPPQGPIAEGLFDYPTYLSHLGIYHQLQAFSTNDWKIIFTPPRPPLADRFCAWARTTIAKGLPAVDENVQLEWALTLGWKAALTEDVAEPFLRASTYHIFAVDGLRIAIISGILIGLLRVLSVPRICCGVLAIPLILAYAALTGWPASAIRAIVMISVVFAGWALKRPSDLLNSLFAAAIIILVWEPRQLFQAGFQLSFFVVLCIVLIQPFFDSLGERVLRTNPLLPEQLRPRWQKFLRVPARFLLELLLISVTAWLGSIPLAAYYFNLFTPLSGPANVIAVPLCALVLISNLSSLLLAGWLPYVAELFNHAGWFYMDCIRITSQWSANWPGAYFYLPAPRLFTLALYYAILLAVFTGWLFERKWRSWKFGCLSVLVGLWCVQWLHQHPVTEITVLPLHGGHAVYVQPPFPAGDWLVDCGDEPYVDSPLKPFLRAHGVNRLSHFVLTHGENSYTGGAKLLNTLFRPRTIYSGAVKFRSPTYSQFQSALKSGPLRQTPLQCGDRVGFWQVLHPAAGDHFPKGEDNSLVLRAEIDGTRILFCSNLGRLGQHALLTRTNDLRADIVIAAPPAAGEPLGELLLDAIQPRTIIIADSRFPAADDAGESLRSRLGALGIPVLYTSDSDAVTISIRPGEWKLRAMDGTRLTFQHGTNTP